MADEDDDFEDLFSFGVSTPGAPSAVSNDKNPYFAPGGGESASSGAAGPALPAGRVRTPRSAGGADDFDDIFGTPPITTAKHRNLSEEFHVHDEDTRDMLEWLDDDDTGKKGSDGSFQHIPAQHNISGDVDDSPSQDNEGAKVVDDDDFDFDQILSDADAAPIQKGAEIHNSKRSTNENEGELQVVSTGVGKRPEENANIKPGAFEYEDLTPLSLSKPPLPACIEKELSFDQWDDENDEMKGLQTSDEAVDVQEATETADRDDSVGASSTPKGGVVSGVAPRSTHNITFSSLADAIRSSSSTADDVRSFFSREIGFNNVCGDVEISKKDRAYLWTKVICGKTLEDIEGGSLADSYREWQKKGEVAREFEGYEHGAAIDSLLKEGCGASNQDDDYEAKKQALISLSYFQSRHKSSTSSPPCMDSLILPVALAILEAGIPPAAASVVLAHIEPSSMPLLRLEHDERYLAAKAESMDVYLLACYHLPMLVMHLDRHCPGWYWPRKNKNLVDDNSGATHVNKEVLGGSANVGAAKDEKAEGQSGEGQYSLKKKNDMDQNGLVPLSWFITNFAGECGAACMAHKNIFPLWDNTLTKGDHSWKYFLAVAVLDKQSDVLLMSRGEELRLELKKVFNFQKVWASSETDAADDGMTREWLSSAKSLMESTPSSVIELLRSSDDRAVACALKVRQAKIDEELQAQLAADEIARKKETLEREKEAEKALTKARLTAYYRTHNPEKVDTIDQILKLFEGRTNVLNDKLKHKYGTGFLPEEDLKDQTISFLMSFNQSIAETRKHVSLAVSERRKKNVKSLPETRSHTRVVLEVSTTEVIPVICTTKGLNLATGRKMSPLKRTSDTVNALHFYLVDCRPESIAAEQGRFPTAVNLSPEKLQDPDELQKLTDMFESLRSAVHICVMGEGFASFPVLYNHTLSKAEEKLLEDDVARTSNCALFFLKKGFPFVSVLRGGFAAAHAFLSRNGPSMDMGPGQVLIEYDPDVSLFAQLETARQEEEVYKNAPASAKTAMTLQKIIDRSMVRLTLEEQRINDLANELAKPETVDLVKHKVVNSLAGFGRVKFMTKMDEKSEEKTESGHEEDKGESATTLSSLRQESSGTSPLDSGSTTSPGSEQAQFCDSLPLGASSDKEKNDDSASKISSAFASLTHLMQQSTKNATLAPMEDKGKSTLYDNPATNESIGNNMSFSSFANRIKQVKSTETKGSEKKDDSTREKMSTTTSSSEKEKIGGSDTSDSPSKLPSAVASLTQRIGDPVSSNSLPTSEVGSANKESVMSNASFSSFAKRIKFGQKAADQLSSQPGKSTEAKEPTDCRTDESKKMDATDNATGGGRFGKFSMSLGGSLSGLKYKAVDAKISVEKNEKSKDEGGETSKSEAATTNLVYGESFNKFSKSIGGFASLLQTKSVPNPRFLFEDEPRPKSRFERLKESEESISFGDDSEEIYTASTRSSEGDELNLSSEMDAQPHGDLEESLFADVPLSSSEEVFADVALSSSSEEVDENTVASIQR